MLEVIHAYTEGAVELRACPNERGNGRVAHLFTRDMEDVAAFIARHDKPGWGVYFSVGTRDPKSEPPGNIEKTIEIPALWADNDQTPKDELLRVLLACPMPPSIVVDSGRGLHPYWLLDEPEDVSAAKSNDHPLVDLLRALRRVFASDPSVCDLARIMRLPGTHNTKYGEPRPVRVIHQSERRYSLSDLRDWLSWQRELIGEPVDPFLAAAEKLGVRPAIDVQAMLAGMHYPENVHDVQLRVSASLVASGRPEDEIVATLLEATKLAAGEQGVKWNWRKEESALRSMIRGATKKFTVIEGGRKQVNGPDLPSATDLPTVGKVARMAVEVWDRPLITVEGELWTYDGGIWEPLFEHDLRAHIHAAARAIGSVGNSTLNGAWRWILEDIELIRRNVEWDKAGVIVGRNACLEIASGHLVPHSPDFYATRRVDCDIDLGAACPEWLGFLADKLPPSCVETLQEWCGASLVRGKRRELTKGLIIHGPSRSGKTQVANVVRALLGGNTCGLTVRAMSERFGMQPLLNCSGWVADDAVGENAVMDAEAYKVIVTGESTSVERKNKTSVEVRFDIPVLLTMNNFPIVKDNSDAVYNRSLALPMLAPEAEETARDISGTVIASELPGVLRWAVDGWRRLSARGWYDPPPVMRGAVAEFKSQNNPFAEFADLCLQATADLMIMRHDLNLVFNEWRRSEYGGREWSGKAIARGLQGTIDRVVGAKIHKGRVWVGVRFTEAAETFIPQDFGSAKRTISDLNMGLTAEIREAVGRPIRTRF